MLHDSPGVQRNTIQPLNANGIGMAELAETGAHGSTTKLRTAALRLRNAAFNGLPEPPCSTSNYAGVPVCPAAPVRRA